MQATAMLPDPADNEENDDAPDASLSEEMEAPGPEREPTTGSLVFPPLPALNVIQALDQEAKALVISDKEIREEAVRRLIKASTLRKKREKEMAEAVKPTLAQEAAIRKPFQLDIGTLKAVETYLTGKISTWDRAELARARDLQAKKNLLIEQHNKENAEKAEEKGLPAPMLQAPAVVQVSDATVKTDEGSLKRKIVKNWTLHNCNIEAKDEKELKKAIGAIPANDPRVKDVDRAYLLLNVKLIDNLVELGQEVPGVAIFDDVDLKTRRGRNAE
jgi:hypothetical protein